MPIYPRTIALFCDYILPHDCVILDIRPSRISAHKLKRAWGRGYSLATIVVINFATISAHSMTFSPHLCYMSFQLTFGMH